MKLTEPGPAVFHGTDEEALAFMIAIEHNCENVNAEPPRPRCGVDGPFCSAHLLVHDQQALDRFVFARRLRQRWQAGERGR